VRDKLFRIEEVRGIDVLEDFLNRRFTLQRRRRAPGLDLFLPLFAFSPTLRLPYHNVLYDTHWANDVKARLAYSKPLVYI